MYKYSQKWSSAIAAIWNRCIFCIMIVASRRNHRGQSLFGLNFIRNITAIFHFSLAAKLVKLRRKISSIHMFFIPRCAWQWDAVSRNRCTRANANARGNKKSQPKINYTHTHTIIESLLGIGRATRKRGIPRIYIMWLNMWPLLLCSNDDDDKNNKTAKSICVLLGAIKVEQIAFTVTHSCYLCCFFFSFRSLRRLMYLFSVDWRRIEKLDGAE